MASGVPKTGALPPALLWLSLTVVSAQCFSKTKITPLGPADGGVDSNADPDTGTGNAPETGPGDVGFGDGSLSPEAANPVDTVATGGVGGSKDGGVDRPVGSGGTGGTDGPAESNPGGTGGKAAQGQACKTTSDCVSGTVCADGTCCDSACTGSCQACDVSGHLGTCTTLAKGASPHANHTACGGTGGCAGSCDGTSSDCSYPSGSCGTASCSAASAYQGAGTCNAGTCTMPAPKTCPNACVVASGGCIGECKPGTASCSASNVPQLCDSNGVNQPQTACNPGFTCSGGSCVCTTGKTNCTTACTDTSSDGANCGNCGHSCLGGTCTSGMCQPIAITPSLTYAPTVFAVDSQYVYYSIASNSFLQGSDSYRTAKNPTNPSAGSLICPAQASFAHPVGVIGSTIFIDDGMKGYYSYTIGTSSAWAHLPVTANGSYFGLFRASPSSYFVQPAPYDTIAANTISFSWYAPSSNTKMATFSESATDFTSSAGTLSIGRTDPWVYGNSVYWTQTVYDASSNALPSSGLYVATFASSTAKTQLCGGDASLAQIVDVNALSILMLDSSSSLVRIPQSGIGQNTPSNVGTLSLIWNATEDSKGVYWMDSAGTLSRCGANNCFYTTVVLASGQGTITGFYQDDTALYWGRSSPNVVMRLAK